LTALALLLGDLGGSAGAAAPALLARATAALRGIDGVGPVLVAGAHAPDGALDVDLRGGGPVAALEAALAEAGPDGAVLLHDPCRTPAGADVLGRALAELAGDDVAGAVAAAPTTDTLKLAGAGGLIRETVDRTAMWEPRTPQAYRAAALAEALSGADRAALDAALRRGDHGLLPSLVPGDVRLVALPRDAVRIERPGDARLLERL